MRLALFVEGSEGLVARRGPLLQVIWARLAEALGVQGFSTIVPISKKHLVAMDPAKPRMSGAGEALDQLMARCLKGAHPFDAAVVAWDLVPAWNPNGGFCRWQETLDLYRHLAASPSLSEPWCSAAKRRHAELASRGSPGGRLRPHRAAPHEVVAVCMEPMFEALLLQREQDVFDALELEHRPAAWPKRGWGSTTRRPDQDVLLPLIDALRAGRRTQWPRVAKTIHADARNKDPWLEYLLRRLLDDPEARAVVLAHPICRRLRECLASP